MRILDDLVWALQSSKISKCALNSTISLMKLGQNNFHFKKSSFFSIFFKIPDFLSLPEMAILGQLWPKFEIMKPTQRIYIKSTTIYL